MNKPKKPNGTGFRQLVTSEIVGTRQYVKHTSERSSELTQNSVDATVEFWVVGDLSVLYQTQKSSNISHLTLFQHARVSDCHSLAQTTFPPVVTIPNSLTLTSTMVPLVITPSCV